MRIGPDGRLYVAQAFGSQVSSIDITSGEVTTVSRIGGPIVGPDDLAFDSRGTLYLTEVMSERVCARSPNGDTRIIANNVPGADGKLYFPAIGANEIWRVSPEGGTPEKFAGDLAVPTAVKFNSKGFLLSTQ